MPNTGFKAEAKCPRLGYSKRGNLKSALVVLAPHRRAHCGKCSTPSGSVAIGQPRPWVGEHVVARCDVVRISVIDCHLVVKAPDREHPARTGTRGCIGKPNVERVGMLVMPIRKPCGRLR